MMNFDAANTGMRITYYRNHRALSQERLSEIVGVSREHLARIETGSKVPSIELLVSIANALGTSANSLLFDSLAVFHSNDAEECIEILSDCNDVERIMLLRTLRFHKALFVEYDI